MTKDEWLAVIISMRPAVRMCVPQRLGLPHTASSDAAECSWCGEAIWADMAQEFPAEVRSRGVISVCLGCILAEPELADAAFTGLPEVYRHWLMTGVVKAIEFGEEKEE